MAGSTKEKLFDRPTWLPTDQWPFALNRYEHRIGDESISIHFTDEGSGPTLVFVHAGMWSFIWRDAFRRLSSDFRCISLDFPGTGLSGGGRHDVDLSTFPGIVNGLLHQLDVDEFTLVIHDLGGVVGINAALGADARVAGIVAVNTFAWLPDLRALRTMLRVMGSPTATALMGTARIIPRMTTTGFGVGRHLDRSGRRAFFGPYRSRARARNFHRAMRVTRRSPELFVRAERGLRTSLNHLPVLSVFGEKNDQFGFADRWHRLFPAARSYVVEGGNHFPMCDAPDDFATEVRIWHRTQVRAGAMI